MDAWNAEAPPLGRTRTAEFMAGVYRWMAAGLALTGVVAWAVTNTPSFLRAFYNFEGGQVTGVTAYGTQKLRALGEQGDDRHALVGALALYLDFINLFLFLLRFLGRRRS